MTSEQWENLFQKMENEGFDYFFTHYFFAEDCDDPKLIELADKYCEAKDELQNYIDAHDPEIE